MGVRSDLLDGPAESQAQNLERECVTAISGLRKGFRERCVKNLRELVAKHPAESLPHRYLARLLQFEASLIPLGPSDARTDDDATKVANREERLRLYPARAGRLANAVAEAARAAELVPRSAACAVLQGVLALQASYEGVLRFKDATRGPARDAAWAEIDKGALPAAATTLRRTLVANNEAEEADGNAGGRLDDPVVTLVFPGRNSGQGQGTSERSVDPCLEGLPLQQRQNLESVAPAELVAQRRAALEAVAALVERCCALVEGCGGEAGEAAVQVAYLKVAQELQSARPAWLLRAVLQRRAPREEVEEVGKLVRAVLSAREGQGPVEARGCTSGAQGAPLLPLPPMDAALSRLLDDSTLDNDAAAAAAGAAVTGGAVARLIERVGPAAPEQPLAKAQARPSGRRGSQATAGGGTAELGACYTAIAPHWAKLDAAKRRALLSPVLHKVVEGAVTLLTQPNAASSGVGTSPSAMQRIAVQLGALQRGTGPPLCCYACAASFHCADAYAQHVAERLQRRADEASATCQRGSSGAAGSASSSAPAVQYTNGTHNGQRANGMRAGEAAARNGVPAGAQAGKAGPAAGVVATEAAPTACKVAAQAGAGYVPNDWEASSEEEEEGGKQGEAGQAGAKTVGEEQGSAQLRPPATPELHIPGQATGANGVAPTPPVDPAQPGAPLWQLEPADSAEALRLLPQAANCADVQLARGACLRVARWWEKLLTQGEEHQRVRDELGGADPLLAWAVGGLRHAATQRWAAAQRRLAGEEAPLRLLARLYEQALCDVGAAEKQLKADVAAMEAGRATFHAAGAALKDVMGAELPCAADAAGPLLAGTDAEALVAREAVAAAQAQAQMLLTFDAAPSALAEAMEKQRAWARLFAAQSARDVAAVAATLAALEAQQHAWARWAAVAERLEGEGAVAAASDAERRALQAAAAQRGRSIANLRSLQQRCEQRQRAMRSIEDAADGTAVCSADAVHASAKAIVEGDSQRLSAVGGMAVADVVDVAEEKIAASLQAAVQQQRQAAQVVARLQRAGCLLARDVAAHEAVQQAAHQVVRAQLEAEAEAQSKAMFESLLSADDAVVRGADAAAATKGRHKCKAKATAAAALAKSTAAAAELARHEAGPAGSSAAEPSALQSACAPVPRASPDGTAQPQPQPQLPPPAGGPPPLSEAPPLRPVLKIKPIMQLKKAPAAAPPRGAMAEAQPGKAPEAAPLCEAEGAELAATMQKASDGVSNEARAAVSGATARDAGAATEARLQEGDVKEGDCATAEQQQQPVAERAPTAAAAAPHGAADGRWRLAERDAGGGGEQGRLGSRAAAEGSSQLRPNAPDWCDGASAATSGWRGDSKQGWQAGARTGADAQGSWRSQGARGGSGAWRGSAQLHDKPSAPRRGDDAQEGLPPPYREEQLHTGASPSGRLAEPPTPTNAAATQWDGGRAAAAQPAAAACSAPPGLDAAAAAPGAKPVRPPPGFGPGSSAARAGRQGTRPPPGFAPPVSTQRVPSPDARQQQRARHEAGRPDAAPGRPTGAGEAAPLRPAETGGAAAAEAANAKCWGAVPATSDSSAGQPSAGPDQAAALPAPNPAMQPHPAAPNHYPYAPLWAPPAPGAVPEQHFYWQPAPALYMYPYPPPLVHQHPYAAPVPAVGSNTAAAPRAAAAHADSTDEDLLGVLMGGSQPEPRATASTTAAAALTAAAPAQAPAALAQAHMPPAALPPPASAAAPPATSAASEASGDSRPAAPSNQPPRAAAAASAEAAAAATAGPKGWSVAAGGAQGVDRAAQLGLPQQAPQGAAPAAGPGLSNATGAYNCFLNVIVQSLWHLPPVRSTLLSLAASSYSHNTANGQVLAALQSVFQALQHGERAAQGLPGEEAQHNSVDPTDLRVALSRINNSSFGSGEMGDAHEALEGIVECLDGALQQQQQQAGRQRASTPEGLPLSEVGDVFGLPIREFMACACGRRSRELRYCKFTQLLPVETLRHAADAVPRPELEEVLAKLLDDTHDLRRCDPEEGGCGAQQRTTVQLTAAPDVYAIALVWDTVAASDADIGAVCTMMTTQLNLQEAYDGLEDSAHELYRLRCVVCYYGSHYSVFVYQASNGRWQLFDDTAVRDVGDWAMVTNTCRAGRMQPLILLYEGI